MGVLLAILQLTLGGALLVAASAKSLSMEEFRAALRLSYLPSPLVSLLAVGIPLVEIALALMLVLGRGLALLAGLIAAGALLAGFTLWVAWVLVRGLRIRCACFGSGSAEVRWWSLARNLMLLGIAAVATIAAAQSTSALPALTLAWGIAVTAIGMCAVLFVSLYRALPALVLTMAKLDRQIEQQTRVPADQGVA
jgi:hypothetical protein